MTKLQPDLAKASWIVGGVLTALIAVRLGRDSSRVHQPAAAGGRRDHRVQAQSGDVDRIETSAASESTMLQFGR